MKKVKDELYKYVKLTCELSIAMKIIFYTLLFIKSFEFIVCIVGSNIIMLPFNNKYFNIYYNIVAENPKWVGRGMAEFFGNTGYYITYLIFIIVIFKQVLNLFVNIRDNHSPFTIENSKILMNISKYFAIGSLASLVSCQIIGRIAAHILGIGFHPDYLDVFSLTAVILTTAMSLIFKYGCILQEESDTTL